LSIASLRELRSVHDVTGTVLDDLHHLAAATGDRPVIVTDEPAIPRLDWERFDDHRWLLVDPAAHPDLPDRLADAGVTSWVLVTGDADAALAAFDGVTVVDRASPDIVLVEHRG
jgi:hypothetical protein